MKDRAGLVQRGAVDAEAYTAGRGRQGSESSQDLAERSGCRVLGSPEAYGQRLIWTVQNLTNLARRDTNPALDSPMRQARSIIHLVA